MIIAQTLKSCTQLAWLKGRPPMFNKLQRQANHREHRTRSACVALELEVQLLRLAYLTNQAQHERGKIANHQQHAQAIFCVDRLAENH